MAAINDAVLDGVDVLNYSIGGTSESDALDVASPRRSGARPTPASTSPTRPATAVPGASTLDHPAPWVTTVAAATVRRAFQAVELGNGARYVGASTTPPLPTPTPLVTSVSVKLAAASDADAKLCAPGTLDPALAAGKVVQCDRGVVDRIAKSFEVQRAGGVGMVMTNTSPNSLNGDYHPIPSVHVDEIARTADPRLHRRGRCRRHREDRPADGRRSWPPHRRFRRSRRSRRVARRPPPRATS